MDISSAIMQGETVCELPSLDEGLSRVGFSEIESDKGLPLTVLRVDGRLFARVGFFPSHQASYLAFLFGGKFELCHTQSASRLRLAFSPVQSAGVVAPDVV